MNGLVVADWSVALGVRSRWPDLPLIASTLMGIQNPAGLRLAAEVGFQRVVLPRPLGLSEIRALAKVSSVDLEVFIARERCRFQNATCRLEHSPPCCPGDPDALGHQDAWCVLPMEDGENRFQVDLAEETLESCGLCALAVLRDLPRVRSFKIVGRGLPLSLVLPFVQIARRLLDQGIGEREAVRQEVRLDGRIRCSDSSCYFPEPLPATGEPSPAEAKGPGRNPTSALPSPAIACGSAPAVSDHLPLDSDRRLSGLARWVLLSPGIPFDTLGDSIFEGVLLGHETCVHLLPSPSEAHRLWR